LLPFSLIGMLLLHVAVVARERVCIMYEMFFLNLWVTILCPVFVH